MGASKNHISVLVFLAIFIFSISLGFAYPDENEISEIIITTDITSIDNSVASAAADLEGIPILIAEDGNVDKETIDEIENLNIMNVIIIGGPAVVSIKAEEELKKTGKNVIRLWGMERTGTGIEVAKNFWRHGAECAVLVEDTKDVDIENDTRLQAYAAIIASRDRCPLIPIPNGKVPVEILDLLEELGVRNITLVLRAYSLEIIDAVSEIDSEPEIIIGIHDAFEKAKDKIKAGITSARHASVIIVAAPHWKYVLGARAQPSGMSLVKIVRNISEALDLVSWIQENNVTDVKVVGYPSLAQEIADNLAAQGINVTKISGDKSSNVAREVIRRNIERWQERKRLWNEIKANVTEKIKAKLLYDINETEIKIDNEENHIDSLSNISQSTIESLNSRLSSARGNLTLARQSAEAGKFVDARMYLSLTLLNYKVLKWELRNLIYWNTHDDVRDEEDNLTEADSQVENEIEKLRYGWNNVKANCPETARTAILKLWEKANVLRNETSRAISSGNITRAARLIIEARGLSRAAERTAEICRKESRLRDKIEERINRHDNHIMKAIEKIEDITKKLKEAEKRVDENETSVINVSSVRRGAGSVTSTPANASP